MALFRIISIDAILKINYRFTQVKCAGARKGAVEGCYSSFHYYASLQEQIASIVASLIKGHFFVDGNKRTALMVYILLARLNDVQYISDDENLVQVFVALAASKCDVSAAARMLFPILPT